MEKVKISKDGKGINFVQSESIPATANKFRQSPEIEGFYRFVHENDLRRESLEVIERLIEERKALKRAGRRKANA